jgi:hypothetical protein
MPLKELTKIYAKEVFKPYPCLLSKVERKPNFKEEKIVPQVKKNYYA